VYTVLDLVHQNFLSIGLVYVTYVSLQHSQARQNVSREKRPRISEHGMLHLLHQARSHMTQLFDMPL